MTSRICGTVVALFTGVGLRGQVSVPPNANVIRLDGRTILPGLIDTHVHLIDWHLPMFLPYGVTTITDLHNDTAWDLAQREALRSGLIKVRACYRSSHGAPRFVTKCRDVPAHYQLSRYHRPEANILLNVSRGVVSSLARCH